MADLAPPTAPATAAPAAPSNGVAPKPSQVSQPSGGSGPANPSKPTPGRMADGRFATREGTVGEVPGEAKAAEAEWRFREKLKVYGEEEEVDLDRASVVRELQRKRMLEKKYGEFEGNDARARRLIELATSDPEGFLRETGKDPGAWARQKLAEEARQGAMTEEERAIHERDAKIAEYEAREKQRTEAETKAKGEARHQKMVADLRQTFTEALERSGEPNSYEMMAELVQTAKLRLAPGSGLDDMTPDEMVAETKARIDGRVGKYLDSLDAEGLRKRFGKERIKAIIAAEIADFEKSQNFAPPPPSQAAEAPPKDKGPREYLSGTDVSRRLLSLK